MEIRPFAIEVPDADLDDLRERLRRTRFPRLDDGHGWASGASLHFMGRLVAYWAAEFDWRAQQRRLNQLPQFIARIDGHDVHYIHLRGNGSRPRPLILTHGWPGSFLEMERLIPLLTQTGTSGEPFDVIVPSLPGFGFSSAPVEHPLNTEDVAHLWAKLMAGLGYERYGAQGGDIGAGVSTWLAIRYPERLCGVHLNYIPGSYRPPLGDGYPPVTADEEAFLAQAKRWTDDEGAYAQIQATKPSTLAFGLSDSPAGLAAWMVEKFRAWSDCNGDVETVFSFDDLLTNISLYWLTGNVYSSLAMYKENRARPLRVPEDRRVDTPFAVAHFPKELPTPPRSWVERCFNVVRWTEMPRGGHFAAMEQPELLAADIQAFFAGRH